MKSLRWGVVIAFAVAVLAVGHVAAAGTTLYLPLLVRDGGVLPNATATVESGATPAASATPEATATPTQVASGDETVIYLGDPIRVGGDGAVVSGSTVTIVDGGSNRVMGTLANGMLAVDTSGDVTLFLDNAETSNSTGPALYLYEADVALVLADGSANVLQDGVAFDDPGAKSALFSNDALVLTGTGALSVNGVCGHGIASDDDVIIDVGQTTISAVTDGIHANDNITIRGGSVRVTGTNDGLESEGGLDCDQCEIALNGGIVVATSGDNSVPSGSSQQQVLVMGSVGVGTVILIESAEQDVLTFRVDKEYWSLIFTSPDLAANETY